MNKSIIYTLILFASFFVAHGQKQPNIVFILADDLGYTDLGCYGNPFNETPNIDALTQGGIRFTNAYAASTVCSPSRAAIMTGKHPARLQLTNYINGRRTDSLSPVLPAPWTPYLANQENTLAEYLKIAGYQTAMVGKWHLGQNEQTMPWNQGFDFNRMISKNGLDYYNYTISSGEAEKEFVDDGSYYLTDRFTDYATEFVNSSDTKKPFFLYLAYSAPHVFIVPKANNLQKYFRKYEKFDGKYNPYYASMIESMDDGVGKLIALLKEKGHYENTLIVFASDNGGVGLPELGPTPTNLAPLRKWKGHIYEGGIRIPTIWHWNGKISASQVCEQAFSNIDYLPTLLDAIGQAKPTLPDATSRISWINNSGGFEPNNLPLFWHYPHFSNQLGRPAGGLRIGKWKYVESYEGKAPELYDLTEDISEQKDLKNEFPEKFEELKNLFASWKMEVKAQMPIKK